jgi:hypothetical protein
MRPVSLSRVVETAYFGGRSKIFTRQDLAEFLHSSERRAKEVADEMANIGLLTQSEANYSATPRCIKFLGYVRNHEWKNVHQLMMDYSFYQTFFTNLLSIEPATPDEILASLQTSILPFNQTSRDVLCDWGERIGSIQRNIFSNQYFVISERDLKFIPVFLEIYRSLNVKSGLSLRQRYVEIPKVREFLCQRMRISRDDFDVKFIEMCMKNIGKIELSGAPVTTHAKKSAKKVKNVLFLELPDKITMKLSSNQFLNGVTIGHKAYYYVAYHGGELND